ncbi:hypothetical protein CANARDRAFT_8733 [[Candida] arabinofermentans NRRL YB-2248]|uniref:Uncharacterized protein n=1 Tax=[Candida] arabinofermentans NRRL YB-2248 TaxID=983967 RepID=A0A1E4SY02_9ASCO|nr:hypothetical protein CANARDRAFT_8733 [[Candida] arabinofermentans NRRL YB-2248]
MNYSLSSLILTLAALFASQAKAYHLYALSPNKDINGMSMSLAPGDYAYWAMLGTYWDQYYRYEYYGYEQDTIAYPDVGLFHSYFFWNLVPGSQVEFLPTKDGKVTSFTDSGVVLIDGSLGKFAGCLNKAGDVELYYYGNSYLNSTKCSPVELSQTNTTFIPWW